MRRELLPLFAIAALFGSLTTLSVVLAVDPLDYPYEVSTSSRNDKALIYTPPPAQIQAAATNCSEHCSRCSANNVNYAAALATEPCHCSTAACRCPSTDAAAASSCDSAHCRQPVVVDLPELLGPTDGSVIDVIKRKLGINVFAGTIYDASCAPPCSTDTAAFDWLPNFEAEADKPLIGRGYHFNRIAGVGVNSDAGLVGDVYLDDDDCPGSASRGVATTSYVTEEPECIECTVGIDALRNSGEDLDAAANQLEKLERYEQADQLRNAAHELRYLARRLRHNGGAIPTVSVGAPMPLGAQFDVLSEDIKECAAEPPPPLGR
jgi:hypothetical protein